MRLFAIVPGFGHPHVPYKEQILRGNIELLSRAFGETIFRVCCYPPGYRLPADLAARVQAVYQPGIVGHFLLQHAHPEELQALGVTHVAIVLDDVELLPGVDPALMLRVMEQAGAHIGSAVLPPQPVHFWKYMMRDEAVGPRAARVASCCELFFCLMALPDYRRYFMGLDVGNPWCWGVDLTLQLRGLKALLFNDMVMRHWYSGSSPRLDAARHEALYFARRGWSKQQLMESQSLEWLRYGES